MLQKLTVSNYLLIRDLEIDFRQGFTVITGETGAGKSILLGAISLILGQRADTGVLLESSEKCVIEGTFSISGYGLDEFFLQNELDDTDPLLLRREISPQGKSRAFINDTPVNLTLLKDLGDRLVNIHSQHAITTLNDSDFQLSVIDSYAGLSADVSEYRKHWAALSEMKRRLSTLVESARKAKDDRDYNRFLVDELISANMVPGELDDIEASIRMLAHAEEIRNSLFRAGQFLSEGDPNILTLSLQSLQELKNVTGFRRELPSIYERIHSDYIDLKDIAAELQQIGEEVQSDPVLLEQQTNRRDALWRLMNKHGCKTVEELIGIRERLESRLLSADSLEEQIASLEEEIRILTEKLTISAKEISARRRTVSPSLDEQVTGTLLQLALPNARFTTEWSDSRTLTRDGMDAVRFMFSANRGVEMRDIASTASGGELSRLMLSVKSMIGQKNLLPTIIFDEIDNGVSGEVAARVGTILKKMGEHMQVIAITHLPQIAARGESHFRVFKNETGTFTSTHIRQLNHQERTVEIAGMISGETVSEAALQTANILLNN